jgi:hypothetical protein
MMRKEEAHKFGFYISLPSAALSNRRSHRRYLRNVFRKHTTAQSRSSEHVQGAKWFWTACHEQVVPSFRFKPRVSQRPFLVSFGEGSRHMNLSLVSFSVKEEQKSHLFILPKILVQIIEKCDAGVRAVGLCEVYIPFSMPSDCREHLFSHQFVSCPTERVASITTIIRRV